MMSILSSSFLLLTPSSSLCEDQFSSSSSSSVPTRQQHQNILLNNNDNQLSRSKKSSLIMSSSSIIISIIICIFTKRSFVTTTDAFIQQHCYSLNNRGYHSPPQSLIRDQATTIISLLSEDSRRTTRIASTATTPKPRATSIRTISTRLGIAKSGGKMINTEQEFADIVLSKDIPRPVLVFFTAPWCGPCRLTVPVVKDVMKQYSGELDVVEICTDDLAEVAEESGVVSIPTIQFYYDGSALETHSIVGCVAKSVLSNAIDKVIEDVAQIRQQRSR